MASRVVEILYKLKDAFTPSAKKITRGYEDISKSSTRAANTVERNTKRTVSALDRARGAITRLRAAWGAFAAIAVAGGIANSIRNASEELDRLGKTAARLGIAANTLNAFEFALERSGVAGAKAAAAIETLQKRTGEAQQGIGEARRAFEALNINIEEFTDLDAEQQFIVLADALKDVASEEERAALAAQLFSKANIEVLNLLNQGGDAVRGYVKEATEYNNVTEEQIKISEEFQDILTNLSERVDGLKNTAITAVVETRRAFNRAESQLRQFYANIRGVGGEFAAEQFRLRQEQEKLREEEQRSIAIAKESAKVREQQAAATKTFTDEQQQLTEQFRQFSDERRAALEREGREYEEARRRQIRIEEEFQDRIRDVTTTALTPEDVSLGDVFGAQRRAAAAAAEGDAERAADIAREGFDLLELLQEKGTETAGTIKFLAEQLKNAATEAAARDTAREGTEAEQAALAFAEAQRLQDRLRLEAPEAGKEYAQLFIEGMRQEFAQAQVQPPAVSRPTRRSLPSDSDPFTDGTDFREAVDRSGTK